MSQSRTIYDEGAYRHSLRESMGASTYIFASPATREYACAPEAKETQANDLLNLDRNLSRCPADKFLPGAARAAVCPVPSQLAETPAFVREEHARVSNPPSTLRGRGVNRFQPLCEDPQRWALSPFHFAAQDRRDARDNHRATPPVPVDVRASLPAPAGALPPETYTFEPTPTIPAVLPVTRAGLSS